MHNIIVVQLVGQVDLDSTVWEFVCVDLILSAIEQLAAVTVDQDSVEETALSVSRWFYCSTSSIVVC